MRLGMGVSLLVGGARSGKSDLAVRLGQAWQNEVVMVATATAGDDDMAKRITRHQQDRPASWTLIEAPQFDAVQAATAPPQALMIVDCLTMLVANLFFTDNADNADVGAHVAELGKALQQRSGPTVVITNEVGLGIHPPNEMSRSYRDLLGRCNSTMAETAESSWLVVAGRVLPLSELTIEW